MSRPRDRVGERLTRSTSRELTEPTVGGKALRREPVKELPRWAVLLPVVVLALVLVAGARADTWTVGSATTVSETAGTSPFGFPPCSTAGSPPDTTWAGSEEEPWIAANPSDPTNLAVSWQQDRWQLYGGSPALLTASSTDGGASWSSVTLPGTACTGGSLRRAADSWLSFAPNGDLYASEIVYSIGASFPSAVLVYKSTDGGQSWDAGTTIAESTSSAFPQEDKEAITADPASSKFAYVVWDFHTDPANPCDPTQVLFSRTTDAGATWGAPQVLFDGGTTQSTVGNQIVVDGKRKIVYDFFDRFRYTDSTCGTLAGIDLLMRYSTDRGKTWLPKQPIAVAVMQPRDFFSVWIPAGDTSGGQAVRGPALPAMAIDPKRGWLYAVWKDARFSSNAYDSIALSASEEQGKHWSRPIKVNQTPDTGPTDDRQAFLPSVDVAANGTVAVTYYDFRNNTISGDNTETDYWLVHCSKECRQASHWTGNETRVTASSFSIQNAPTAARVNAKFLGDYEGLTHIGNTFALAYVTPGSSGDPADVQFATVGP